jgi:hypothetical protein
MRYIPHHFHDQPHVYAISSQEMKLIEEYLIKIGRWNYLSGSYDNFPYLLIKNPFDLNRAGR